MIQARIGWRRVGGITAVQAAITLCWVIYAFYLPELLVDLGYRRELAIILLNLENLLEVAIEPLFGGLSDRTQSQLGTRLPWIGLGVVLSAALLLFLPFLTWLGSPSSAWRWLLPVLAVAWAAAMAIFRSPTLVLLGRAAPTPQLPLAAAALTLVEQLVGALRFTAYTFILSLGPLFTFAIGSLALLVAAAVLRVVTPPDPPDPEPRRSLPTLNWRAVVLFVGTGIALATALRFSLAALGQTAAQWLGDERAGLGLLVFSTLAALCALPAGKLATRTGNTRAMAAGAVATGLLILAVCFAPSLRLARSPTPPSVRFQPHSEWCGALRARPSTARARWTGPGSVFWRFGRRFQLF
ncbi:MAG: MFS transporter [Spirulinaceae cyanobacterium RM2_2_10]|nr:MFS transporter [Spirulinaceae cyanobacterium RM2_2_10]